MPETNAGDVARVGTAGRPDAGSARGAGADRPTGLRLTLLTAAFSDTQLLRAHCLDAVAQHLGHQVTVVTTEPGEVLPSLAATPFATRLHRTDARALDELVGDGTDVLLTLKALPESLGQGLRVLRRHPGVAHLADIDDPDIEARTVAAAPTAWRTTRKLVKRWRTLPGQARLAVQSRRSPTTVSNPVLQRRWGGVVVPHARVDPGPGTAPSQARCRIAFVGTAKAHKGIHLLRDAVARLAGEGWELLVTDVAPADARPWETWTGRLDGSVDAAALTADADVVVIPSLDYGWARAQLPLKLVDAMLMGRPVVVSDVGPLPWAVGEAGAVFPAGDVDGLVGALRPLRDAAARTAAGSAARRLALERYAVPAVAPHLTRALSGVLRG
ncbi:glycosyltransferase [Aquipuribacter sp. SD81]|uniref:glycosyltransferase n=1 Tax=Aquipuribacter sp. SD81 TaxID=3127703 RepID=UPI0030178AE3